MGYRRFVYWEEPGAEQTMKLLLIALLMAAVGLITWGVQKPACRVSDNIPGMTCIIPTSDQFRALSWRIKARTEVVERLSQEEISLDEAIARFRMIEARTPGLPQPTRDEETDEEVARRVKSWLESHLDQELSRDQVRAQVARLGFPSD